MYLPECEFRRKGVGKLLGIKTLIDESESEDY